MCFRYPADFIPILQMIRFPFQRKQIAIIAIEQNFRQQGFKCCSFYHVSPHLLAVQAHRISKHYYIGFRCLP